jgi:hypothetical protein
MITSNGFAALPTQLRVYDKKLFVWNDGGFIVTLFKDRFWYICQK